MEAVLALAANGVLARYVIGLALRVGLVVVLGVAMFVLLALGPAQKTSAPTGAGTFAPRVTRAPSP